MSNTVTLAPSNANGTAILPFDPQGFAIFKPLILSKYF